MINFNEQAFINWANHGDKGSKSLYADCQPCLVPDRASLVRALIDKGVITATSKVTRNGKDVKWEAIAIKC